MNDEPAGSAKRGVWQRAGRTALGILGFFVLLEPLWMLLPFAGFLYGSVLRIESLSQHRNTAWLTHFVFPVLTLGWTGPILVIVGLAVFFVGAGQIYWAKCRRSGMVSGGLYRWVRHPQYIALTLFGVGILLTWGRAITFLAFFLMMFAYYYLAKREERLCLERFGEEYERYRQRTSFVIPGDRWLRSLLARLPMPALPAWVRVAGAFAITVGACFLLMWVIDTIKAAVRVVPYLTATVTLGPPDERAMQTAITGREAGGVAFAQAGRVAVVRGPWRSTSAPGFAERLILRLPDSKELASFLAFLDAPGGDVLIVFCAPWEPPSSAPTPGAAAAEPSGRGPPPDPGGPDRVRLIMLRCAPSPGASVADALADKSKRQIRGGCIAQVNVGVAPGQEIVEGTVVRPGPAFPGEERWDSLMRQYAARPVSPLPGSSPPVVPGSFANARLVLVQAPILRTRLDPDFAAEILRRAVHSATLRGRLRSAGAGGDVVAVAFPRPGPNWYSEHHGTPQISLFVVLARLRSDAPLDDLFRPERRQLLGAFTAEMDFGVNPPADCVGQIAVVGPKRDIEERWRFFLSGVGAR